MKSKILQSSFISFFETFFQSFSYSYLENVFLDRKTMLVNELSLKHAIKKQA